MPQFTRITKVGAFSDDVANQINDNFAQLGTVLAAHGIDPHEQVKDPKPGSEPRRERSPLDPQEYPKPGQPGGPPAGQPEPAPKPTEPDDDDKDEKSSKSKGTRHADHK